MSRVLLKTSGRTGSHLLLDEYEQKGFRVYFTATDKPNVYTNTTLQKVLLLILIL